MATSYSYNSGGGVNCFKTHSNSTKLLKTPPNPVQTLSNWSKPVTTHPNPSKPCPNLPNPTPCRGTQLRQNTRVLLPNNRKKLKKRRFALIPGFEAILCNKNQNKTIQLDFCQVGSYFVECGNVPHSNFSKPCPLALVVYILLQFHPCQLLFVIVL